VINDKGKRERTARYKEACNTKGGMQVNWVRRNREKEKGERVSKIMIYNTTTMTRKSKWYPFPLVPPECYAVELRKAPKTTIAIVMLMPINPGALTPRVPALLWCCEPLPSLVGVLVGAVLVDTTSVGKGVTSFVVWLAIFPLPTITITPTEGTPLTVI